MLAFLSFGLLILLSIGGNFEANAEVILSVNSTTAQVGQPILFTCELKNISLKSFGNAWFDVVFYRGDVYFNRYHNSEAIKDERSITFAKDTYLPDLIVNPISAKFPIYEITITHRTGGSYDYYIHLYSDPVDKYSNHFTITVSSAVFSANVTTIVPKQPFTAACTFANFNPLPVNYVVTFSSTRDGQLAFIEVVNGTALQSDGLSDKVDVSAGTHSTFPTFDLELTEKIDASSSYWCALEETGKMPVVSEAWPVFVKFTSSKPADNQRLGTCTVGANINVTGKEYTVQYFTDLGSYGEYFLAEYAFKPNHTDEFKFNHLAPWTLLRHGPITSWPTFTILANGTSFSGQWWCVLAVGAQGAPNFKKFRSNNVNL